MKERMRCRSCGKTKLKERGRRCPDCQEKYPSETLTHCKQCGKSFEDLPFHAGRKYCSISCKGKPRTLHRAEMVTCPGCLKQFKVGGIYGHAKRCPSNISPSEVRAVIKATKRTPEILEMHDWTLNKPIEQLNKEYYDEGLRGA